ncbi:hypothetical protein BEWA_016190 [Theileria equi strain WA]|uniref:Uncharacterized protein n=1 Tax=Theileria equi strain WA TaxID=1537102 RepID=L1LD04_THEEQ|nr:hypothetical protein BEWA_016190 [Theileria equi strain WA]EKX73058.1 hypothetical protein BEWA_016190 [Theileria equi strain WA]|eukprot:XP_004832510.1 hypothetical protein BEWA_016190 [Theileria equi strain WA]
MSAGVLTLNVQCQGSCTCNKADNSIPGLKAEKKTSIDNAVGFVSYTHSSKNSFTLKGVLYGGDTLGEDNGEDIEGVTKVSVYYWDGDENKPLVIEVVKRDSPHEPEYFYKHDQDEEEAKGDATIWRHHGYSGGTSLQDRLDDRNASINNVLPLDLERPNKPFNFSSSLSKNVTIELVHDSKPPPGSEYVSTAYKINGIDRDTRISRIEYQKQKIKDIIIPTGGQINGIRFYSSTSISPVPIMINFDVKGGDSKWYYSTDKSGTKWAEHDDGSTFYGGDGNGVRKLLPTS